MATFLWDASALAKRYGPELGSDTVDALFDTVSGARMVVSSIGYAETYSILLRRRNRGDISRTALDVARSALRDEVLRGSRFRLLSLDDAAIFDGLRLIDLHNINATDAGLLSLYLRFVARAGTARDSVLVAADTRLLRAAQSEGLPVLNPEDVPPADLHQHFPSS